MEKHKVIALMAAFIFASANKGKPLAEDLNCTGEEAADLACGIYNDTLDRLGIPNEED